jgi:hypothetical protein
LSIKAAGSGSGFRDDLPSSFGMAQERRTKRAILDETASAGLVVRVTPGGRLEWVTAETPASEASNVVAQSAAESTLGAQVVSDRERALIEANRERLEELKALPNVSPDLRDIVSEMMAMAHPPTLSLAVAAWILQATGLIPMPVFDSAAAAVTPVGYVGRRVGHKLHAAQVPQETSDGATRLWHTHPGLTTAIVVTVMDSIIGGIKAAMTVDDTELENELDAFYPRWSRTDFEFDLRRYQR